MKKLILISLFNLFLLKAYELNAQFINGKITIIYLGYGETVKHLPVFEYEIKNISRDTIFISENDIKIKVSKKKQILMDEKYKGFIPPDTIKSNKKRFLNWFDQEERLLPLKQIYANKLYVKNFGFQGKYQNIRNNIINGIVNKCIVILPNEKVVLGRGFYNKKFDKTCVVEVKYIYNRVFTYFVDDSNKRINIYH